MPQTSFALRGPEPDDVKRADDNDLELWSVTTLIGVLDKPALLYWAAEQTAKAAVNVADSLPARINEDGRAQTIKWLRDARFRMARDSLTAASLGTVIHATCEEYALTGTRPDGDWIASHVRRESDLEPDAVEAEVATVQRTVDQFDAVFLQRFAPEYIATEVTVYSPKYGYAGTADGFVNLGGTPVILDYKTSRESFDRDGKPRTPYPEVALQLAAYRYASKAAVWRPRRISKFRRRYYLLSQEELAAAVAVPEVEGGIVVHLTPDHCGVFPIVCDEKVWRSFLMVIEAARFVNEVSKGVIGAELVPPTAWEVR